MSDIAKVEQQFSPETCEEFLGANFPALSRKTKAEFMQIAKAFGLNPFKRQIYITGYKGQNGQEFYSVIIGYEVYIQRAQASGMLDGWAVVSQIEDAVVYNQSRGEFQTKKDLVATCTIYRKDFKHPFVKSVSFSEYAQMSSGKVNRMWSTKPRTMLEKVATAQAFRLAFPAELGGIGYQAEELGGSEEELRAQPIRDVSPQLEATQLRGGASNEDLQESSVPSPEPPRKELISDNGKETLELLAAIRACRNVEELSRVAADNRERPFSEAAKGLIRKAIDKRKGEFTQPLDDLAELDLGPIENALELELPEGQQSVDTKEAEEAIY